MKKRKRTQAQAMKETMVRIKRVSKKLRTKPRDLHQRAMRPIGPGPAYG